MNKKEEGCRFCTLKDEFDTWGDFSWRNRSMQAYLVTLV